MLKKAFISLFSVPKIAHAFCCRPKERDVCVALFFNTLDDSILI